MVGNVIVKSELFPTSIFEFCAHKKLKLIRGGHLEFQQNLKKNHLHISISWGMYVIVKSE